MTVSNEHERVLALNPSAIPHFVMLPIECVIWNSLYMVNKYPKCYYMI